MSAQDVTEKRGLSFHKAIIKNTPEFNLNSVRKIFLLYNIIIRIPFFFTYIKLVKRMFLKTGYRINTLRFES